MFYLMLEYSMTYRICQSMQKKKKIPTYKTCQYICLRNQLVYYYT